MAIVLSFLNIFLKSKAILLVGAGGSWEEDPANRGRIQIQGPDVNGVDLSFPWAQNNPIAKETGLSALESLKSRLTRTQLRSRTRAFAQAEQFIRRSPPTGRPGPGGSFRNRD